MNGVTVEVTCWGRNDIEKYLYDDVDGWYVTNGELHIEQQHRDVAVYAPGWWASARTLTGE